MGRAALQRLLNTAVHGWMKNSAWHDPVANFANRLGFEVCFAAGTPLRTPGGSKPIEAFRPGDPILSADELDPSGPVEVKVVEEVFRRYGRLLNLHAGGRVIRTTAEHPFYARERGWVPAGQLVTGDTLRSDDGQWIAVEGVADSGQEEVVYNLRVSDHHTYFVGSTEWGFAVWAHNADCTLADLNRELIDAGFTPLKGRQAVKFRSDVLPLSNAEVADHLATIYGQQNRVALGVAVDNAVANKAGAAGWQRVTNPLPDRPDLVGHTYVVDGVMPIEIPVMQGNWRAVVREALPGKSSPEGVYIVRDQVTGQLYKPGKVKDVTSSRITEYAEWATADGRSVVLDFYPVTTGRYRLVQFENALRTRLKADGWNLGWDGALDKAAPSIPVRRMFPLPMAGG